MEYAKNVLKLPVAKSNDKISELFSLLIAPMSCSLIGETQDIVIQPGSLAYEIYRKEHISERFNCNYSLNEQYRDKFQSSNLQCVGVTLDGAMRIVELQQPQFFLAMLFQPQLSSMDNSAHPVITEYLRATIHFNKKTDH